MNFLIHSYEDNDTGDEFDLRDSAFLYWAWAASVVGPVVYILAVVHAVLWGLPSAIVGSLVCICSMYIVICKSYVLMTIIMFIADSHSWYCIHSRH